MPHQQGRKPNEEAMDLKTVEIDGKTYAEVQDGKPVFLDNSGKEIAFDAAHATQKISQLNGEAKSHREAKEAAEAKLKAFEGIEDPSAAKKALETVQNLDSKQLIDAGKVEEVKAAVVKSYEEKLAEAKKAAEEANNQLYREKIGGSFARSKFIAENLVVPGDLAEAAFGKHFTIEDGKVVAKDASGNPIYSSSRHGEYADFDEALEQLVNNYPNKDQILKGRNQTGTGARGGNGGGSNASRTIPRSEFNAMDPTAQRTALASGVVPVD